MNHGLWDVDCTRCGLFRITNFAGTALNGNNLNPEQTANLCGYIRHNNGIVIKESFTEFLLKLPTPTLLEKTVMLFQRIAEAYPRPGHSFSVNHWGVEMVLKKIANEKDVVFDDKFVAMCQDVLPWLSYAWAEDGMELAYLVRRVLEDNKCFLEKGDGSGDLRITPIGWSFLLDLRRSSNRGSSVFVAMWFNPTMDKVWAEAFALGIEDAGYNALRIDKHQHNNRIDDEIIVKIKESRFLVADFTARRGGVYFEAGFALGLGKPVIWTVREEELSKIHFDTRQYAFVTWKCDDLPKLRRDLQFRIEATIGKGPLATKH
jgi:hypothetical protein